MHQHRHLFLDADLFLFQVFKGLKLHSPATENSHRRGNHRQQEDHSQRSGSVFRHPDHLFVY